MKISTLSGFSESMGPNSWLSTLRQRNRVIGNKDLIKHGNVEGARMVTRVIAPERNKAGVRLLIVQTGNICGGVSCHLLAPAARGELAMHV